MQLLPLLFALGESEQPHQVVNQCRCIGDGIDAGRWIVENALPDFQLTM